MKENISVYPVTVSSVNDMIYLCEKIGTDSGALKYLLPKSEMIHIYAEKVDYRAANFIKQEMLSRGGDTAAAKHVIDGKTDYSDILIIGTARQILNLTEKMKAMNIWGLKELREKIGTVIGNLTQQKWDILSTNGSHIFFDSKTRLMGIMNLTPDSFFDGSRVKEAEIIERAEKFLNEGAYIIDIGAESTRPGALPVSEQEEEKRLMPALKILRKNFPDALISVDTYKAHIAKISVHEGADIINDISGGQFDSEMFGTIAGLGVPYVLSHTEGRPEEMTKYENHSDILGEVNRYFSRKIDELKTKGVNLEKVIIDCGLGFGKSASDNFALLKNIESLSVFGRPLMIGHSRKRFTGGLSGTIGITAMMSGRVSLMRVHDVKENIEALRIAEGMNQKPC